jgi:hypothetical protein
LIDKATNVPYILRACSKYFTLPNLGFEEDLIPFPSAFTTMIVWCPSFVGLGVIKWRCVKCSSGEWWFLLIVVGSIDVLLFLWLKYNGLVLFVLQLGSFEPVA